MSDLTADAEKSGQNKIALRARLLTARRSLSDEARSSAAAQLQDQTLALVRRTSARTVAAYVPTGSEPGGPSLPHLLAAALPPGGHLLLPVLLPDNDLDWAVFTGELKPASRGLHEPTGPRLGPEAIRTADLLLVPALAVADDGTRMGRGGGSYDRALSRLLPHTSDSTGRTNLTGSDLAPGVTSGTELHPGVTSDTELLPALDPPVTGLPLGTLTVALLHDGETLASVPTDPHDRTVQAVLTPSGGFSHRPLNRS